MANFEQLDIIKSSNTMKKITLILLFCVQNFTFAQVLEKLELFRINSHNFDINVTKDFIENGSRISIDNESFQFSENSDNQVVTFKFSKINGFNNAINQVIFKDCHNLTATYAGTTLSSENILFNIQDSINSNIEFRLTNPTQKGKIGKIEFRLLDVERFYINEKLYGIEQTLYSLSDSSYMSELNKRIEGIDKKIVAIQQEDTDEKIIRLQQDYSSLLNSSFYLYTSSNDVQQINNMGRIVDDIVGYLNPIYDKSFNTILDNLYEVYKKKYGSDSRIPIQINAIRKDIKQLTSIKVKFDSLDTIQKSTKGLSLVTETINLITGNRFKNLINVGKSFFSLLQPPKRGDNETDKMINQMYGFIVKLQEKANTLEGVTSSFNNLDFQSYKLRSDTIWHKLIIANVDGNLSHYYEVNEQTEDQFSQMIVSLNDASVSSFSEEFNDELEATIIESRKDLNSQIGSFNRDLAQLKSIISALSSKISDKETAKEILVYLEKKQLPHLSF